MIIKHNKFLSILLISVLILGVLSSCGNNDETSEPSSVESESSVVSESPEPISEPEESLYTNPLTGLGTDTDISTNRPIAIMINNLKAAQPQLGVSQADIIYEVPAEGGITRMLAVFQSVEGVGEIGTVRSARDYYVSLAAGLDAVFLHAGGSEGAYSAIKSWDVDALDCVNGPYEGTLFWRDSARRNNAGYEHSVLTSGEKISSLLPTYNLRLEHDDGYTAPFSFTEDGTPESGTTAEKISVVFSSYKTGVFEYDAETGLYEISQYGSAYLDGNDDTQVAVRNVLILNTQISVIDSEGRLSVKLVTSGSGQYACGGKITDIKWEKESNTGAMHFYNEDGSDLELGAGKSYINIIGTGGDYNVIVE